MNRSDAIEVQPSERRFGARARRRLEIAAGLLRRGRPNLAGQGEAIYTRVLQIVDSLGETDRAALRELVDWVEQYERAETLSPGRPERKRIA